MSVGSRPDLSHAVCGALECIVAQLDCCQRSIAEAADAGDVSRVAMNVYLALGEMKLLALQVAAVAGAVEGLARKEVKG